MFCAEIYNLLHEICSFTKIFCQCLSFQAPIFDPSTTDDPDFYVIEVSRQDGSHPITRNVPASADPLMITLNNLMKGTSYRARIVAYNDRGVGTFTDFVTAQTLIDRKFMSA